jgi:hypothetical protein
VSGESTPIPPADVERVARLARFCAELYRAVPLQGHGLLGEATELAHAAALDAASAALEAAEVAAPPSPLTARDIQVACQLLIDVRRAPKQLDPLEVALVRRHFPEVEAPRLDDIEALLK